MNDSFMRCPFCMQKLPPDIECCPHCGRAIHQENELEQLPVGTLLAERYVVGRCIGSGGFGVTYIGWDNKLDMVVAIKEYYPAELTRRCHTQSLDVTAVSGRPEKVFQRQKSRFFQEARTLAKFSQDPNIVCVRDLFEEHNTAYIVMEYLKGKSLKQMLEEQGAMPFDQALQMLLPVMESLAQVHQAGLIHRDISPSNLMVLEDGSVKLLDFGTAREFEWEDDKSRSIILKPGYSPEEQYRSHGEQGPWTDGYALCATLYKMITGSTPENAMNRLFEDTLARPSACGAVISAAQEQVLLKGMSVRAQDRYPSISELKAALLSADRVLSEEDGVTLLSADGVLSAEDGMTLLCPEEAAHQSVQKGTPSKPEPCPVSARPTHSRHQSAHKESRSGTRPGGKLKWILPAAAVCVIAAGVLLIPGRDGSGNGLPIFNTISSFMNPYRDGSSYVSHLENETVTKQMVNALRRDVQTESVHFYKCVIDDRIIAQLADIDHIKGVSFEQCSGFTTLAPLANMGSLNRLDLEGDALLEEETMFPAEFPNITELHIGSYQLKDESALLGRFPNLQSLHLNDVENISFAPIAQFNSIETLSVLNSTVTNGDYTGLSGCTGMTYISISETVVEDLSWVSGMTMLERLEIRNESSPHITDISALSNHTELKYVYLNNCQIADLTPLRASTQLYTVELNDNQLVSLAGLETCTKLNTLKAAGNHITDISALESCTSLSDLNLSDNRITDISALSNCQELITLVLNDNPIGDASVLAGCDRLVDLYLNRTGLTNLDFCTAMIDLKMIYARENQITQLNGLANTTQLTHVALNDNLITDISPLSKNVSKLEIVYLHHNQLTDVSPLSGATELDMMTIDGNQLKIGRASCRERV